MSQSIANPVRFSLEDLERMIEAGIFDQRTGRIELIEGELRMMSPASYEHDDLIQCLNQWSFESSKKRFRIAVQQGLQLRLTQSMPEPDLYWIDARHKRDRRPTAEVVPLVIEVSVSSLAYDLGEKQRLYAMESIAEYWVVDPNTESVIVHRQPLSERYATVTTFSIGQPLTPLCAADSNLDLQWLFRR